MDSFAEPHRRAEPSLADIRAHVARLEDEHRAKGIPLSGRILHVCHYLPVTCALAASPLPPSAATTGAALNGIPSPPQTPPAGPTHLDAPPPSPLVDNAEPESSHPRDQDSDHSSDDDEASAAPPGVNAIHETQERFLVPTTRTVTVTSTTSHDALGSATTTTTTSTTSTGSRWQLAPRYGHSAMVSGIASLAATHEQVFVGWTGDVYAGPVRAEQEEYQKMNSGDVGEEERKELEGILGELEERGKDVRKGMEKKRMRYVPVWLDEKIAHGHYDGYCKQSECRLSSLSPHFLSFLLSFSSLFVHFPSFSLPPLPSTRLVRAPSSSVHTHPIFSSSSLILRISHLSSTRTLSRYTRPHPITPRITSIRHNPPNLCITYIFASLRLLGQVHLDCLSRPEVMGDSIQSSPCPSSYDTL